MAITNNIIKLSDCVRLGSERNFCVICATKAFNNLKEDRNINTYNETLNSFKGKLYGKPIIYLNRRGLEQCICMDCVKEIAKEYTDLVDPSEMINLSEELIINEPPKEVIESGQVVVKEEVKEKKDNKKKTKK